MSNGNSYANLEALVSTEWVAQHKHDPNVRLVEVDVDTSAYDQGHILGAIGWNWQQDLQRHPVRDLPTKEEWEELLSRSGITNDTTVILYGDNNNWFAAFAYWVFKLYGHNDARLMDGGRKKWVDEGRELVSEIPSYQPTTIGLACPIPRCGHCAIKSTRHSAHPIIHWWTSGAPASIVENCSPRRTCPRRARSAAGISREPTIFHGAPRWLTMAPSKRLSSCGRSMARKGSRPTSRSSRTAGLGSAAPTPGLCCTNCWAMRTCGTTTVPGQNGAAWWAHRSRKRIKDSTGRSSRSSHLHSL